MTIIMSDIHGNIEALDAVLKDVGCLSSLDRLIILGDMIDYGADSFKVVQTLDDVRVGSGAKVLCLKGNHEAAFITKSISNDMIRTSYGRLSMDITRKDFLTVGTDELGSLLNTSGYSSYSTFRNKIFVHGTPRNVLRGTVSGLHTEELQISPTAKVVFGGHTHLQGWTNAKLEVSGGYSDVYINPGSVGQPRNGDPRAQYLVCDDDLTHFYFKRVEYDIDKCARKIEKSGRPSFLATRLYLGI